MEERKFKFMLSGIKEKSSFDTVIKKLGGELSTELNFDPTATHLLCLRPARNEKLLGSIAAGKWVLHCTYLRDCDEQGKFIDVSSKTTLGLEDPKFSFNSNLLMLLKIKYTLGLGDPKFRFSSRNFSHKQKVAISF